MTEWVTLWDTAEFVNYSCIYAHTKRKGAEVYSAEPWTAYSSDTLIFSCWYHLQEDGVGNESKFCKKEKKKKITSTNLQAIQDLLVFSLQIKNTCQADFQHSMRWVCSKTIMNIKKTLSRSVQFCIWSLGKSKKNSTKTNGKIYDWHDFLTLTKMVKENKNASIWVG